MPDLRPAGDRQEPSCRCDRTGRLPGALLPDHRPGAAAADGTEGAGAGGGTGAGRPGSPGDPRRSCPCRQGPGALRAHPGPPRAALAADHRGPALPGTGPDPSGPDHGGGGSRPPGAPGGDSRDECRELSPARRIRDPQTPAAGEPGHAEEHADRPSRNIPGHAARGASGPAGRLRSGKERNQRQAGSVEKPLALDRESGKHPHRRDVKPSS